MSDFAKMAMDNSEFRNFLKQHPEKCVNVVIWAAFGFKNYAEQDAVALLHAYNNRNTESEKP